jgi:hypothetical protein
MKPRHPFSKVKEKSAAFLTTGDTVFQVLKYKGN